MTIGRLYEAADMLAFVGKAPESHEWVPWVAEYYEAQKHRRTRGIRPDARPPTAPRNVR